MADPSSPSDVARQMRNLNALLEVSKAMASKFRLDDLLLLIVGKTTEVMDAERSSLFLYDAKRNEIWTKIAQGILLKEIRLPVGIGIAGDVAKTGKGTNIPDAYDDPRFNPEFDRKTGYRTRSVLCLPMHNNEGQLVGVIQVLNKKGGGIFDAQDESLLAALGAHAAVALEQARLIEAFVEKQRLEEALKVAQGIQMSLLPKTSPQVPGFDIAGWSIACDETGGDYFDYIVIPDGRVGIVIGDVSGHGLGAAMYMATARASLRSLMMNETDPAKILSQLNNRLATDMSEENFMTLFFGILDPASRTFRYTSAGHEDPLIYRAAHGGFDTLPSTGLPLGMVGDSEFPEGDTARFHDGDILLLTTDGVFEAVNEQDEQLGHERMKEFLHVHGGRPAEEITRGLRDLTYTFMGKAPQRDDITIVTVKATPLVPAEPPELATEELGILELAEADTEDAPADAAAASSAQTSPDELVLDEIEVIETEDK